MDINTFENVRGAVHAASLVTFCLVVLVGTIGAFKPKLLSGTLKEFAERKFIIGGAIFACLLCATVFTATQSVPRPYESSAQTPNTSGSIEQPNRQVYEGDGETEEQQPPTTEFGASDRVLGSNTSGQTAQQQQTQGRSAVASAPQAQPPAATPPASEKPKICRLPLIGDVFCP